MNLPTTVLVAATVGLIGVGLAVNNVNNRAEGTPLPADPVIVQETQGTPFLDAWEKGVTGQEPPASTAITWQDLLAPPEVFK